MAYITNADIQLRLGNDAYVQLTDDDGDGQADTAVVDEARLAAEGEVNSYLARRYRVPIDLGMHADLADVLASFTLDLAEFRLRVRRPPVAKEFLEMRDRALDWLRGVADGSIALPSAVPLAANVNRGPLAQTTGEPRVLSHQEMSGH